MDPPLKREKRKRVQVVTLQKPQFMQKVESIWKGPEIGLARNLGSASGRGSGRVLAGVVRHSRNRMP